MEVNVSLSPPGAIVVTPWYGGTHGGVAVASESLVHGLLAAGAVTVAVLVAPDGWMPRVFHGTAGEEVVELCVRPRSTAVGTLSQRVGYHLRQNIARESLRRIVRQYQIRIVHFEYVNEGYADLARQAHDMGLKVVTTFHGADVNNTLRNPSTRYMVDEIVAESNHVTVVSRTLFDRLKAAIPAVAPRLTLIHNAVPTTFAAGAGEMYETDVAPSRWDVLLVGQLIPRKGGDVLLDALARVRERIPNVRAAFAGTGYFEEELRAQVSRLNLESNVDFLGELSRERLTAAYRSSKLLVIASRSEGLPLVLLEALWLGVPVVATAVDGLPEVVVEDVNGLLVPPENASALAVALLRLLLDGDLRRRLGRQARASIVHRFSPKTTTEKYLEVYRQVLADM